MKILTVTVPPNVQLVIPYTQIYTGRKTDQCGVVLFGSEGSDYSSTFQQRAQT